MLIDDRNIPTSLFEMARANRKPTGRFASARSISFIDLFD